LPNQTPDGDQFDEFAPHDQGFSLLRTPRQTFTWYLRASIIPAIVLILVVAVAYGDLNKHHSNPVTVVTQTTTTTTQPPPTTTTTRPHHVVTRRHPTTTTTRPRPPATTTTPRPVTTTTVFHPTTTVRPVTTTTIRHHRRPVTTTTRHVTTGTYKISFTCSGGQSVTVSGTGPTSSNTLTVTGPSDYSASGTTATVSFTALAGTYVATDHDSNGGTFINYASGGQASACS
jgi:hypothetical protein